MYFNRICIYADDIRKIAVKKLNLFSVKMKMFIEIPMLKITIAQHYSKS